jgi:type IV secretion system protein VirB2
MKKSSLTQLTTVAYLLLATSTCFAAGSGMPWESPLNQVLDSFTGNVAKACGVIAIGLVGIGIAFSEGGGFMRKILNIAFGLTILFSASTFFLDFFGFAGGIRF